MEDKKIPVKPEQEAKTGNSITHNSIIVDNSKGKPMPEDKRTRNWTCVMYPESMAQNWQDILAEIPSAVSPLHDADVNGDGSEKKAHYHVMFGFEGVKTYSQVLEITKKLNATIPKIVHSARSMLRYFCHLDNPDKAQYKPSDIMLFGGFSIESYFEPTKAERHAILLEIISFCRENRIVEFSDLVDYALTEKFEEWAGVLMDGNTVFLNAYIKSNKYRLLSEIRQS